MRSLKIMTVLILLAALTGCGKEQQDPHNPEERKIGIAVNNLADSAATDLILALQQKMGADDEVIVKDARGNSERQESNIEDLLQETPDILLVIPVRYIGLEKQLQACQAQGIPVLILQHETMYADLAAAQITFDYADAGQRAADYIAGQYEGEMQPVSFINDNRIKSNMDQAGAFMKAITDDQLFSIGTIQYTDGTVEEGIRSTRQIIERRPDTRIIWCMNEASAAGAAFVLHELKLEEQIKIVSSGGSQEIHRFISQGTITCSAVFDQEQIASRAIAVMEAVLEQQAAERLIKVLPELVTADLVNHTSNER